MRRTAVLAAAILAMIAAARAQTATFGSLRGPMIVVTNEQDAAALAAVTNEAALRAAGDAARPTWAQGTNVFAGLSAPLAATNAAVWVWLDGISGRTNLWNQAWAWNNHALAGYASTQQVAAVAADLDALAYTVENLPPPDRIAGTNQWIDGDGGVWRVVQADLTNDTLLVFFHSDFSVYGAVTMTNSGPFEGEWWHQENDDWFRIGDPYAEDALYVAAYWSEGGPTVPWIPATPFDKTTFPKTFSHSGATGWVARATYPATVTSRVDAVSLDSGKNLHADSFTNLVWRSVYSNGWHFLVAHTNTP